MTAINSRSDGKPLCSNCGSKRRREVCIDCKKSKAVARRLPNGEALCHNCHRNRGKEVCVDCKKLKPVHKRLQDGGALCSVCLRKRDKRVCADCKQLKVVASRRDNGDPLCPNCSRWVNPRTLYGVYKFSAARRQLALEIPFDSFERLISQPCVFCGSTHHVGLDRIDNGVGYTEGNCQSCCGTCNYMRGTMTIPGFIAQIEKIMTKKQENDKRYK